MRKTAIESGIYGTMTYRDATHQAKYHVFRRVRHILFIQWHAHVCLCELVLYIGHPSMS